jgi:type II secretory pathway pseudopilin PulG
MRGIHRGKGREAGYNMVMLVVAITVLNIMVAVALPLMSTQIQREKEEELVFRGFQYAEAIRLFHQRFQHNPTKLEQLLEVKPRCIRQLWKDPMTKDGKWGLIFQGQGTPITNDVDNHPKGNPDPNDPKDPKDPGTAKGDELAVGPIVGVYSKSSKKSFLVLYGRTRYDEWRFTEDLLRGGNAPPPSKIPGIRDPGAGAPLPNFSVRWLGRPMPFMNQGQQPQDGTMPGGVGNIPAPGTNPKPKPGQRPQ